MTAVISAIVKFSHATANDDSFSVLKRAEAALDAVDRHGGNRACYHDGEHCSPIEAVPEVVDYLA